MAQAQDSRLDALEDALQRIENRLSATPGGRCSALRPHPDQLVYMRGPNHYACQCGQIYKKDGSGGLMEAS